MFVGLQFGLMHIQGLMALYTTLSGIIVSINSCALRFVLQSDSVRAGGRGSRSCFLLFGQKNVQNWITVQDKNAKRNDNLNERAP